jgi:hypothetical protein
MLVCPELPSLDTAFEQGYVQGSWFLPPYTRVQGGPLLRPLLERGHSGMRHTYEFAGGAGNGAQAEAASVANLLEQEHFTLQAEVLDAPDISPVSTVVAGWDSSHGQSSHRKVTIVMCDSGVYYAHAEYRYGLTWPWLQVDPTSGVTAFCWGTQSVSPLFTLQDVESLSINLALSGAGRSPYATFDTSNPAATGDYPGDLYGKEQGANAPYSEVGLGVFASKYPQCNDPTSFAHLSGISGESFTTLEYWMQVCRMVDDGQWHAFQPYADVDRRQNAYIATNSKLPHYKLAPSRFGALVDGSVAVCDGQDDAYRYMSIWKPNWAVPAGSWPVFAPRWRNSVITGNWLATASPSVQSAVSDWFKQDPAVCVNVEPVQTIENMNLLTSSGKSSGGGVQTITWTEDDELYPWSFDARNGNMCTHYADSAGSEAAKYCFRDDPRTCMLETIPQVNWMTAAETTPSGAPMRPYLFQWQMLVTMTEANPPVHTSHTEINGPNGEIEGYLCKCAAPVDSLFHPPYDFIEFGALLTTGQFADGWGYWGPSKGHDGNSPFFEHCPCGVDFCGHGTAVGSGMNSYHFGVAADLEVWAIKMGQDNCVVSWFSTAIVYYQAGYSYRMPAVLSASMVVDTGKMGAKDAVAEAVMFATYRMGLLCLNAAANNNLDACLQMPAALSPYVVTVGATTIKLSSKLLPNYEPMHTVGAGHSVWTMAADGGAGQVPSWDTLPVRDALTDYLVQDQVVWWTNDGKCVDIYGPGDANFNAFVNNMLDMYGRDWGSSLLQRGYGTSYATPKIAAVAALILHAHFELDFKTYSGGHYNQMEHCNSFLQSSVPSVDTTSQDYCHYAASEDTTFFAQDTNPHSCDMNDEMILQAPIAGEPMAYYGTTASGDALAWGYLNNNVCGAGSPGFGQYYAHVATMVPDPDGCKTPVMNLGCCSKLCSTQNCDVLSEATTGQLVPVYNWPGTYDSGAAERNPSVGLGLSDSHQCNCAFGTLVQPMSEAADSTTYLDNTHYYSDFAAVSNNRQCKFGVWHQLGRSCGADCGSHTLLSLSAPGVDMNNEDNPPPQMDYYLGYAHTASDAINEVFVDNTVHRPMFQTKLANRNNEKPRAWTKSLPYHLLFYTQMLRMTLVDLRSEIGTTTSATLWYKPYAYVKETLVSLCGGGKSAAFYEPGYGHSATVSSVANSDFTLRPCCPICVEMVTKHAEHSKHCAWPYITGVVSLEQCASGTSNCYQNIIVPVGSEQAMNMDAGSPSTAVMLLARMQYDVALSVVSLVKSDTSASEGESASGGFLWLGPATRPFWAKVPNSLHTFRDTMFSKYSDTVTRPYQAAANELFVGSPAVLDEGLMLEIHVKIINSDNDYSVLYPKIFGDPLCFTSPSSGSGCAAQNILGYSQTSNGLMYNLGCATADFYSGLPWCLLGSGRYDWSYGAGITGDSLFAAFHGTAVDDAVASWPAILADVHTQSSTSSVATAGLTADEVRKATTTGAAGTEKRLNCLMRHYNFMIAMLSCADSKLGELANADPGCRLADYQQNRYGCLCRRRARYALIEAVAEPTVSGNAVADVVINVISGSSGSGGGGFNYSSGSGL